MLACSFSFFQNGLEPWPQTGFFFKKLLGTTQGIIIIIINSKVVGQFFLGGGHHTGYYYYFKSELAGQVFLIKNWHHVEYKFLKSNCLDPLPINPDFLSAINFYALESIIKYPPCKLLSVSPTQVLGFRFFLPLFCYGLINQKCLPMLGICKVQNQKNYWTDFV